MFFTFLGYTLAKDINITDRNFIEVEKSTPSLISPYIEKINSKKSFDIVRNFHLTRHTSSEHSNTAYRSFPQVSHKLRRRGLHRIAYREEEVTPILRLVQQAWVGTSCTKKSVKTNPRTRRSGRVAHSVFKVVIRFMKKPQLIK